MLNLQITPRLPDCPIPQAKETPTRTENCAFKPKLVTNSASMKKDNQMNLFYIQFQYQEIINERY